MSNTNCFARLIVSGLWWGCELLVFNQSRKKRRLFFESRGNPWALYLCIKKAFEDNRWRLWTLKNKKCLECLEFDNLGKVNIIIYSGLQTPSSRYPQYHAIEKWLLIRKQDPTAIQNARQPSRASQPQSFSNFYVMSPVLCVLKETIKIQLQAPNHRHKKKSCSAKVRLESYFDNLEKSMCGG